MSSPPPPSVRNRARAWAATSTVVVLTAVAFGGLASRAYRDSTNHVAGSFHLARPILAAPERFVLTVPKARGDVPQLVTQADDAQSLAGYTLDELPVRGDPKVVAIVEHDESVVGRWPTFHVLYDQPIDLEVARQAITLTHPGEQIALSLRHSASGELEGGKVAPRQLVEVRPNAPLEGRGNYRLEARDARRSIDGRDGKHVDFEIAGPLELVRIDCGNDEEANACLLGPSTVRIDGSVLRLRFNHRLRAAGVRVVISPPLRPVATTTHGPALEVAAPFRSDTRYRVQIAGVADALGQALPRPLALEVERAPLSAEVMQPTGVVTLPPAQSGALALSVRNAGKVAVQMWPIHLREPASLSRALRALEDKGLPEDMPAPQALSLPVAAIRDQHVSVSLPSRALDAACPCLLRASVEQPLFGSSAAPSAALALVIPADKGGLVAHYHRVRDDVLVHVARLGSSAPVVDAHVELLTSPSERDGAGQLARARTAADGTARLEVPGETPAFLLVSHGSDSVLLAPKITARDTLFPALSSTGDVTTISTSTRAYIYAERGAYRPGDAIYLKAMWRNPPNAMGDLSPVADHPVTLVMSTSAMSAAGGLELARAELRTNALGAVDWTTNVGLGVGPRTLTLRDGEEVLAQTEVLVAETELPRFLADVPHVALAGQGARTFVDAEVTARYPSGTALAGARVNYTVRSAGRASPVEDVAGMRFARMEAPGELEPRWQLKGEGVLNAEGALHLHVPLPKDAVLREGQRVVVEADVSDDSARHVAARGNHVVHLAKRYAGVALDLPWGVVRQPLSVRTVVRDAQGTKVPNVPVDLRLVRAVYHTERGRGSAGWSVERREVTDPASRCHVSTPAAEDVLARCELRAPSAGEYFVVSRIDGRDSAEQRVFVRDANDGAEAPPRASQPAPNPVGQPLPDRRLEVRTDKASYKVGDVAQVAVRTPFTRGVGVVTVEQGSLLSHRVVPLQSELTVFELPVTAQHTPWVNVTVTALSESADYRIGATRVVVEDRERALALSVKTSATRVTPGAAVELDVEVTGMSGARAGGAPVADADVSLAVVAEVAHRLRGDAPPRPQVWLSRRAPLRFEAADSRDVFGQWLKQSHVAGDGAEGGAGAIESDLPTAPEERPTVFFLPAGRTDAQGRVHARLIAPPHRTEFRVTATAVDLRGRAAAATTSFMVDQPVKLSPVLPRFLGRRDTAEGALLIHNDDERPRTLWVRVEAGRRELLSRAVDVPPRHPVRLAFPLPSEDADVVELHATASEGAIVVDEVRRSLPVRSAVRGRPARASQTLTGSFAGALALPIVTPASLLDVAEPGSHDAQLEVVVQSGAGYWPELAEAVEGLLEYPYGCLEQTTSATLPLLLSRTLRTPLGLRTSTLEIRRGVEAGLSRLASMQLPSGGLAYWPGGGRAHAFGTAYALLALDLAARANVAGAIRLRDRAVTYLHQALTGSADSEDTLSPDTRAFIAAALHRAGAWDDARLPAVRTGSRSAFGRACLAMLGIATQSGDTKDDEACAGQDGGASAVEDLERAVVSGGLLQASEVWQPESFGSNARTRAMALMALARHRPEGPAVHMLGVSLLPTLHEGTTQERAFALLALADGLAPADVLSRVPQAQLFGPAGRIAARDANVADTFADARGPSVVRQRFVVPLSAAKELMLDLRGDRDQSYGFSVTARYPQSPGAQRATGAAPHVFRYYTDVNGKAIDPTAVQVGALVRVGILVSFPVDNDEVPRTHLALVDPLPAGFEPVDPRFETVTSLPASAAAHPLAGLLREGRTSSHVELLDDQVRMFWDGHVASQVAATYVMRATTRGRFVAAQASAELMYHAGSLGLSEEVAFVVR